MKKTPESKRRLNRKLRREYPEKYAARSMVRNAIILGILVRPDKCSECQQKCKPSAHHEDYKNPLMVLWLCNICHQKKHNQGNIHGN